MHALCTTHVMEKGGERRPSLTQTNAYRALYSWRINVIRQGAGKKNDRKKGRRRDEIVYYLCECQIIQ